MFIKILIYICVIMLLFTIERLFDKYISVEYSSFVDITVIFTTYIVLLYIEIRTLIANQKTYTYIRHKCFLFSFVIGFILGVLMSFADGRHPFHDFTLILLLFANYILTGAIFGIIGLFLLKVIYRRFQILV
jgi:hypothetical protein